MMLRNSPDYILIRRTQESAREVKGQLSWLLVKLCCHGVQIWSDAGSPVQRFRVQHSYTKDSKVQEPYLLMVVSE